MAKTLILTTAGFPFGEGEPFLSAELPHLTSAFDRVLILSNDTTSPLAFEVPPSVRCHRRSYELTALAKGAGLAGFLHPRVWRELDTVRSSYRIPVGRKVVATALTSWHKAHAFARLIRSLAKTAASGEVHAYSYWANDMALAAALARQRGWVQRAYCRAHGWDVYMDRTGYLPFRDFLATNLDHVLFVSEHGRRHFESYQGRSYPSLGVSRLGTAPWFEAPVSRHRPFTVMSCGGLIPIKRVELIAQALHRVVEEMRWVHVGDGPSRAVVEAACRGLPPHVSVELCGPVANAELPGVYGRERPSLFLSVSSTEGLPVSMMEAMSAGVPVMTTLVGGVGEIVSDGHNGILLGTDPSPGEVADALDAFAGLPQETHAGYARRAWETWDARFRADRNYHAFLDCVLA